MDGSSTLVGEPNLSCLKSWERRDPVCLSGAPYGPGVRQGLHVPFDKCETASDGNLYIGNGAILEELSGAPAIPGPHMPLLLVAPPGTLHMAESTWPQSDAKKQAEKHAEKDGEKQGLGVKGGNDSGTLSDVEEGKSDGEGVCNVSLTAAQKQSALAAVLAELFRADDEAARLDVVVTSATSCGDLLPVEPDMAERPAKDTSAPQLTPLTGQLCGGRLAAEASSCPLGVVPDSGGGGVARGCGSKRAALSAVISKLWLSKGVNMDLSAAAEGDGSASRGQGELPSLRSAGECMSSGDSAQGSGVALPDCTPAAAAAGAGAAAGLARTPGRSVGATRAEQALARARKGPGHGGGCKKAAQPEVGVTRAGALASQRAARSSSSSSAAALLTARSKLLMKQTRIKVTKRKFESSAARGGALLMTQRLCMRKSRFAGGEKGALAPAVASTPEGHAEEGGRERSPESGLHGAPCLVGWPLEDSRAGSKGARPLQGSKQGDVEGREEPEREPEREGEQDGGESGEKAEEAAVVDNSAPKLRAPAEKKEVIVELGVRSSERLPEYVSRKPKLTAGGVPFLVGDHVEARSHEVGFRGAWFRCEVVGAKVRPRARRRSCLQYQIKYLDFELEKSHWLALYEDCPHRDGYLELMIRPTPPGQVAHVDYQACKYVPRGKELVVMKPKWEVGDLVDWWTDECWWTATVVKVSSLRADEVKIVLPKPPKGEQRRRFNYAKVGDLRSSLVWDYGLWSVAASNAEHQYYTSHLVALPEKIDGPDCSTGQAGAEGEGPKKDPAGGRGAEPKLARAAGAAEDETTTAVTLVGSGPGVVPKVAPAAAETGPDTATAGVTAVADGAGAALNGGNGLHNVTCGARAVQDSTGPAGAARNAGTDDQASSRGPAGALAQTAKVEEGGDDARRAAGAARPCQDSLNPARSASVVEQGAEREKDDCLVAGGAAAAAAALPPPAAVGSGARAVAIAAVPAAAASAALLVPGLFSPAVGSVGAGATAATAPSSGADAGAAASAAVAAAAAGATAGPSCSAGGGPSAAALAHAAPTASAAAPATPPPIAAAAAATAAADAAQPPPAAAPAALTAPAAAAASEAACTHEASTHGAAIPAMLVTAPVNATPLRGGEGASRNPDCKSGERATLAPATSDVGCSSGACQVAPQLPPAARGSCLLQDCGKGERRGIEGEVGGGWGAQQGGGGEGESRVSAIVAATIAVASAVAAAATAASVPGGGSSGGLSPSGSPANGQEGAGTAASVAAAEPSRDGLKNSMHALAEMLALPSVRLPSRRPRLPHTPPREPRQHKPRRPVGWGFRGVYERASGKFEARHKATNGRKLYYKIHPTAEAAARVVDLAEWRVHGRAGRFNFADTIERMTCLEAADATAAAGPGVEDCTIASTKKRKADGSFSEETDDTHDSCRTDKRARHEGHAAGKGEGERMPAAAGAGVEAPGSGGAQADADVRGVEQAGGRSGLEPVWVEVGVGVRLGAGLEGGGRTEEEGAWDAAEHRRSEENRVAGELQVQRKEAKRKRKAERELPGAAKRRADPKAHVPEAEGRATIVEEGGATGASLGAEGWALEGGASKREKTEEEKENEGRGEREMGSGEKEKGQGKEMAQKEKEKKQKVRVIGKEMEGKEKEKKKVRKDMGTGKEKVGEKELEKKKEKGKGNEKVKVVKKEKGEEKRKKMREKGREKERKDGKCKKNQEENEMGEKETEKENGKDTQKGKHKVMGEKDDERKKKEKRKEKRKETEEVQNLENGKGLEMEEKENVKKKNTREKEEEKVEGEKEEEKKKKEEGKETEKVKDIQKEKEVRKKKKEHGKELELGEKKKEKKLVKGKDIVERMDVEKREKGKEVKKKGKVKDVKEGKNKEVGAREKGKGKVSGKEVEGKKLKVKRKKGEEEEKRRAEKGAAAAPELAAAGAKEDVRKSAGRDSYRASKQAPQEPKSGVAGYSGGHGSKDGSGATDMCPVVDRTTKEAGVDGTGAMGRTVGKTSGASTGSPVQGKKRKRLRPSGEHGGFKNLVVPDSQSRSPPASPAAKKPREKGEAGAQRKKARKSSSAKAQKNQESPAAPAAAPAAARSAGSPRMALQQQQQQQQEVDPKQPKQRSLSALGVCMDSTPEMKFHSSKGEAQARERLNARRAKARAEVRARARAAAAAGTTAGGVNTEAKVKVKVGAKVGAKATARSGPGSGAGAGAESGARAEAGAKMGAGVGANCGGAAGAKDGGLDGGQRARTGKVAGSSGGERGDLAGHQAFTVQENPKATAGTGMPGRSSSGGLGSHPGAGLTAAPPFAANGHFSVGMEQGCEEDDEEEQEEEQEEEEKGKRDIDPSVTPTKPRADCAALKARAGTGGAGAGAGGTEKARHCGRPPKAPAAGTPCTPPAAAVRAAESAGTREPVVPSPTASPGLASSSSSGYRGVYCRTKGKFVGALRFEGKLHHLFSGASPAEAARAVDAKEWELRGASGKFNFPEDYMGAGTGTGTGTGVHASAGACAGSGAAAPGALAAPAAVRARAHGLPDVAVGGDQRGAGAGLGTASSPTAGALAAAEPCGPSALLQEDPSLRMEALSGEESGEESDVSI